jgi:hypothetical protein
MEDFADPEVNEITVLCSAQSAKTLTLLCLVAWVIVEDPGPILWVTAKLGEAKKLSKGRVLPLLERCAPVAEVMPTSRMFKTTLEIYFPGAPLYLTGAESPASLQSTPFRYVILDEARSYPDGALEMVSKRFRSYTHNYKKIIITTPAAEGDAVHRAFQAGHRARWEVECPACGEFHEMQWGDEKTKGGLKWDKNDSTYDAEKKMYIFEALEKTVRYECWNPDCTHSWRDVLADRKHISTRGKWMVGNLNAPSNSKSYTWGALVPWWASWNSQVREFLLATKAVEWGDFAPLKDHFTETRGEVWTDKLRFGDDDKYLAARMAAYDPLEPWPEEVRRFMSVDVQGAGGRHFWYVIRAWGAGAKSRLLTYGKAHSWDELASKAEEWRVEPDNVVVDSGKWAPEVYQKIIDSNYRWKAFKGDDAGGREGFRISGKLWLYQKSMVDPTLGKRRDRAVRDIELYVWAKYGVIARLYAFMHGAMGEWAVHEGVGEDYKLQVTSWDRRSRIGRNGYEMLEWFQKRKKDEDHLADCEQMQVVAAAATGLLHLPEDLELWKAAQAAQSERDAQS